MAEYSKLMHLGKVVSGGIVVQNGGGGAEDLDDLSDVVITNPVDYQVLCYDATTGKWTNQGVSGASASVEGNALVLSGNSYTVSGNTLVID